MMTLGHGTDANEAAHTVGEALDASTNFFDTADEYSDGEYETIPGCAIGRKRRDVGIATKMFTAMSVGPNDSGMSASTS